MLTRSAAGAVCILSLALAPMAIAEAPCAQLTLTEALELALRHNARLRAKEREYEATRASETTARLRPNPNLSYAAEQLGSPGVETQHTVALSQTIETGSKRRRRIESARAAAQVSEFELADVRRQVIAQVKKALADVLMAEATVKLASENLQIVDEVERVNRLRAEKGEIAELELRRIQTPRFGFERDLADATQAVEAPKIALRTAVGPEAVAPEFAVVGELDCLDLTLDREHLLREMLARRPDIRAAEAGHERRRAAVGGALEP